jgi:hypothetical protein
MRSVCPPVDLRRIYDHERPASSANEGAVEGRRVDMPGRQSRLKAAPSARDAAARRLIRKVVRHLRRGACAPIRDLSMVALSWPYCRGIGTLRWVRPARESTGCSATRRTAASVAPVDFRF